MTTPLHLRCVAALAATTLLASAASAGERQRLVRHADLDLSTAAGQATLKQRVNGAVRYVCAAPAASTLAQRADQRRCETRARTSAMRQAGQVIARYGASVKIALD